MVGPNKHTHTRAHEVTLVWGLTQARPNHCYFGTYPFSSFIISDSFRGIIRSSPHLQYSSCPCRVVFARRATASPREVGPEDHPVGNHKDERVLPLMWLGDEEELST